jgi:hypothetical protein
MPLACAIISLVATTLLAVLGVLSGKKIRVIVVVVGVIACLTGIVALVKASKDMDSLLLSIKDQKTDSRVKDVSFRAAFKSTSAPASSGSAQEVPSQEPRFYVRVAADTSKERLIRFRDTINSRFPHKVPDQQAIIRDPRPNSRNYELVFGRNLDLRSALEQQQFIISQHLQPQGDLPPILLEPGSGT